MGDLEEEVDEEEREQEEDLYYSSLLDSKLDSCPQQPFNEPTNRLWNAVYSQVQRKNRVEMMSRWEQIQRGYISQEQISSAIHIERKNNKYNHYEKYEKFEQHRFVDTIIDVNDILQTHHSLDDVVRNTKPTTSITLAKSTGSLDELLDSNNSNKNKEVMEMRSDRKWKERKMKLHIKKKRRENLRMKKKTMQQRNHDKQ